MKLISYLILALFTLSSGTLGAAAEELSEPWGEQVAPGIEYREYHLPDPVNIFVTRMERSDLDVTLESSIAQGRLSGGVETVNGMAQRYDGAINYWGETWGNSNDVVVAINGFYFGPNVEAPGVPWSGQVNSGWYSKHFWERESESGLAWKMDRSIFIGECISHPADKQKVNYFRGSSTIGFQFIDGINVSRDSDQLVLYTPQYDATTGTGGDNGKDDGAVEVLVQLSKPSLIVKESEQTIGTIIDIRSNKGSTPIPFDHVVLSMEGTEKDAFDQLGIEEDDQVGISHKIKNCGSCFPYEWENTYASIGNAFYFLKDGVVQDFSDDNQANVRDPRTAIAYNDDFLFFIVVDGRDAWNSIGMTIPALGEFAKDELEATYGVAQDGGGSSTMVVNGQVMNNTYCNIVKCEGNVFLPIITGTGSKPKSGELPPEADRKFYLPPSEKVQNEHLSADGIPLTEQYYAYSMSPAGSQLQRLVANGMLMVIVEPKDQSPIFSESEKIKTLTAVNVRLGPGTNYASIETVPGETTGIIYGFDNDLNGVWAKGYYWWRVLLEIDGRDVIGWVIEPALTALIQ
jgi:hypothetical protein